MTTRWKDEAGGHGELNAGMWQDEETGTVPILDLLGGLRSKEEARETDRKAGERKRD